MMYLRFCTMLGIMAGASGFMSARRPSAAVRASALRAATTAAPQTYTTDGELPECPLTVWGKEDINFESELRGAKKAGPMRVEPPSDVAGDREKELQWLEDNKAMLRQEVLDGGAVLLRGFSVTKEPAGFMEAHRRIGLQLCLDPLHSVAARDKVPGNMDLGVTNGDGNVAKKGGPNFDIPGLYQAVNKQSRSKYFVGMHNEMVGNRANRFAAFVCFKPADEGGEFLVLDTREMAKELSKDALARLRDEKVRFVTAELPFSFVDALGPAGDVVKGAAKPLLDAALKLKVDFEVDSLFEKDDEGNTVFRVIAEPQAPVIRHPETEEPVWFCNIHSHSKFLRDEREKRDGKLGATTGASKFNKTDVRFADLQEVPKDILNEVDRATMAKVNRVKMQQGDVVLLDNYLVMHGRDVFSGERMHGVAWSSGWDI